MLAELDMSNGINWHAFQTAGNGLLTVAAEGEAAGTRIELYTSAMLPVAISVDTGRLQANVAAGESYLLYARSPEGETNARALVSFQPIGTNTGAHTNPASPLDVNGDGAVTPLDALLLINDLNNNGSPILAWLASPAPYLDVNGDGSVTPIDVLVVVNHLNALGGAHGEGEAGDIAASGAHDEVFRPMLVTAGGIEQPGERRARQPSQSAPGTALEDAARFGQRIRCVDMVMETEREHVSCQRLSNLRASLSPAARARSATPLADSLDNDFETCSLTRAIDELSEALTRCESGKR
jgi:hypothetical protein